jgi:beta-galactosidase
MVSFRNKFVKVSRLLLLALLVMPALQLSAEPASQPRTVLSADADWKFFLGDPAGAESPTFKDDSWRTVTVPHDWSIEGPPSQKNPTGPGRDTSPPA